jgi:hypothetical protein
MWYYVKMAHPENRGYMNLCVQNTTLFHFKDLGQMVAGVNIQTQSTYFTCFTHSTQPFYSTNQQKRNTLFIVLN